MADNFNSISRDVWQDIRSGTPFEQQDPDTGEYTANFYGLKKDEGIKFDKLTEFVKNSRSDATLIFSWEDYAAPATYERYKVRSVDGYVDRYKMINNTVAFTYVNEKNLKIKTAFSGKLNKRHDYLENGSGFTITINPGEKNILGTLNFYFDNTKQFRKEAKDTLEPNDYTLEEKYIAIALATTNLTDFCYMVKALQGDADYQLIKRRIAEKFADKIRLTQGGEQLDFLYENIPDFAFSYLKDLIEPKLAFEHLKLLKGYDEDSWFTDTSSAIVNVLRVIGDSMILYNEFYNNPKLIKELYQNLDGASVYEGVLVKNRMIFADLLWMLCANQQYNYFGDIDDTFYIGNNYKLDSNVLAGNDTDTEKIYLLQLTGKQEEETIFVPDDLPRYSERLKVTSTNFYAAEGDIGAYFHPLYPVYLIDADSQEKITYKVPAIFVKALSDEAEWKDIKLSIRIGVDVLAIVLSIASLGTGSPLLLALTAIDVTLATVDIGVALSEDKLMQSQEGREFIDNWNKIVLAGGAVTALPLIGSTITLGARLFSRATQEATKNFLRAGILRLLLETNIANFTKNTLRVVEPTEIYQSIDFLDGATNLFEGGVVFVQGEIRSGNSVKEAFAALYKGEVIAQGSKFQIAEQLKDIWKLKGETLAKALEDTYGLKKIDEAIARLGIKNIPKNTLSAVESAARLRNIIAKLSRSKNSFKPGKKALRDLGIKLPKSKVGLSVDFANTSYLYPVKGIEKNIVKIKLTGKRRFDDKLANELAGFKRKPDDYTWHHLDDYNPVDGTCTMQLVAKDIHIATIPHFGSVELIKKFLKLVEYK